MIKDEIVRKIYSKIDELPTLPTVLTKVLGIIEDRRSNTGDIATVISQDPALTAKVLKVANSAYYGFPGRITGLEHAITLLGFNMIRSLTISMSVINTIPADNLPSAFSEKDLWIHSITVATALEKIARGHIGQHEDHMFIVGLLHDIGKLLFAGFFPDLFERVMEEHNGENDTEMYRTEKRLFGIDHGEAGGLLLKRWRFPEVIAEPIFYHHTEEIPDEVGPMKVSLLKLSDRLSFFLYNGRKLPDLSPEIERLGISPDIVGDTLEYLRGSREKIESFYDAMR